MQEFKKRVSIKPVLAQTATTTSEINQATLEAKKTLRKGNVIITGASSGLGLATAKALAETETWHIIMAAEIFSRPRGLPNQLALQRRTTRLCTLTLLRLTVSASL